MGEIGLPELLLILAIAVIIFGPRKLGELGKGLGEGIKGFKSALSGEKKEEPPKGTPGETKPS